MHVKVKLFAFYRDIIGKKELKLEIERGRRVEELLNYLIKRYPKLGMDKEGLVVSVNYNYASLKTVLNDGDEVALLPPVSGG